MGMQIVNDGQEDHVGCEDRRQRHNRQHQVKAQIESKEHTPVTKQTVWREERMLNNNWKLSLCGIL
jgi:hypothetical protein